MKMKRKEEFLVKKYGVSLKNSLENLNEEDRLRYKDALIFKDGP